MNHYQDFFQFVYPAAYFIDLVVINFHMIYDYFCIFIGFVFVDLVLIFFPNSFLELLLLHNNWNELSIFFFFFLQNHALIKAK